MTRWQSRGQRRRARKRRPAAKSKKPSSPAKERKPRLAAKNPGSVAEVRSEDDAFVDKIVATAMETTEIMRKVGEYRLAHPPVIPVQDAISLRVFLQNARKAYRKAHPPNKRGPKFSEGRALVWIDQLENQLKRPPTRKEIITRLVNKDEHGANTVSDRTAQDFATLYLLISRRQRFSKVEARWLRKNFGPKVFSPHWWRGKKEQWFHDRLEATGLSKEIRDCFALSSDELEKERKELEALRLQHTYGKL